MKDAVLTTLESILLLSKTQSNKEEELPVVRTDVEETEKVEEVINMKVTTVPYVLHQKEGSKEIKEVVFEVESKENQKVKELEEIDCELAVVLDTSGSMGGDPLENCKKAIYEIMEKLPSKAIFHLVIYHSYAEHIFSGVMSCENKEKAKGLIQALKADYTTNIVDGIVTALKSIYSFEREKHTLNRRIFIFTDGVVNQGVKEAANIFSIIRYVQTNFQINFTSFGLGSEFDEKLMKGIAQEGKGDYFFIEGAEDITNKVQKGLSVFSSLYAINAHLHIQSLSGDFLTVSVADVSGYRVAYGSEGVSIPIGDICYDDLRQVLLFLNVETKRDISMDPVAILTYNLEFDILHSDGSISKSIKDGKIEIEMTEEADKIVRPDPLKVAVEIYQANQIDKQILPFIKHGKYEEALALKEKSYNALLKVLPIDTTGVVSHLLKITESTIASLKSKKQSSHIVKDVGYSRHLGGIVHRKCF